MREETDPIKRQFNTYKVREGARLRTIYDAKLAAESCADRLEQQIARAEQELHDLSVRAQQLRPGAGEVTVDTPLPTDAMVEEYQRVHTKADMTRAILESWRELLPVCRAQRDERSRAFENHYREWARVMWYLTKDAAFQPTAMYFEQGDQVLDDQRRAALERRKAQIEDDTACRF